MQLHIATLDTVSEVFWWKSYSPPLWLLDGKIENITTTDLMGMQKESMMQQISSRLSCSIPHGKRQGVYLVAPHSAVYLDQFLREEGAVYPQDGKVWLDPMWRYRQHLNLDDLDFGDDGFIPTIKRVVGRRGLLLYKVNTLCPGDEKRGEIPGLRTVDTSR